MPERRQGIDYIGTDDNEKFDSTLKGKGGKMKILRLTIFVLVAFVLLLGLGAMTVAADQAAAA